MTISYSQKIARLIGRVPALPDDSYQFRPDAPPGEEGITQAKVNVSAAHGNIREMSWLDLMQLANEVMPRHWRRYLVLTAAVTLLVFPSAASRALTWYVHERAEQIIEPLVGTIVPEPSPIPERLP